MKNTDNSLDSGLKGSSIRTAGIVAGIGYIALFILAIFANFVVKEGLIVSGNAGLTAENILNKAGLFPLGDGEFSCSLPDRCFCCLGTFYCV